VGLAARILLFAGFVAVVLGVTAVFLLDTPYEYRLTCERATGLCTFTQRAAFSKRTGTAPIASLGGSHVRVAAVRGAPRIQTWIRTRDGGGDHYVADYSGRKAAEDAARRIDAFLADSRAPRLDLVRDDRTGFRVAAVLLFVPFAALALLAWALFRRKARETRPRSAGE
jgi:hypothetical protein